MAAAVAAVVEAGSFGIDADPKPSFPGSTETGPLPDLVFGQVAVVGPVDLVDQRGLGAVPEAGRLVVDRDGPGVVVE